MTSDEKNVTPEGSTPPETAPTPAGIKTKAGEERAKRGHPFLVLLLLVVAVGEAAYIFRAPLASLWKPPATSPAKPEKKVLYWEDPMHPQYRSDKPGKAPDCGMDLVPVYAESTPPPPAERKVLYWQDPMHPQYKSDKPGKAPDCGMDLVPVYEEQPTAKQEVPAGAFRITPEKQQLIGVQYGVVETRSVSKTIRAVAQLTYDETRITKVHSRIAGWIERVYADFTGQLVKEGQPLLSIYSPELLATQDEYLLALKARDKLGSSTIGDVAAGAGSLLEAARKRLELWDMTEEQIAELDKTRKPARVITLYCPSSGFVVSRNAFDRQRIQPETELYAIANLSTIWAIAEIYEFEAPLVRLGQRVSMTLTSFPGRVFGGRITYIYPQMDNATRTLKVRVEFPNPGFALKPDMYADVELRIDFGRRLAVPGEAVLDSGSEQIVFVALDGGYFEPRKVELGDKVDNQVIVLSGLREGERVVTSGNFLIDSESTLKSALSGMGTPGMDHAGHTSRTPERQPAGTASPQPPPMDHSQHGKADKPPAKEEPMDHSKHKMEQE